MRAYARYPRIAALALIATLALAVAGAALAMTAKPSISSFSPLTGAAGTKVTVTGKNLTGVTAVKIGTMKAVFTLGSATKITLTVPSKAKTGKITVMTKGGSTSSAKSFKI